MPPRRPLLVVLTAALASTALRAFLAHVFDGFQTGDDVEIAQEALRRAAGLDYAPWALRNLFVSDVVVAPFVTLATLFGVTDFSTLAAIARWPFIVLAGVNVVLLFLVGRRWFDDATAALASVLYAAHWLPLVYGSSLYPRIVAATCILGACLLLASRDTARVAFLAGLLASIAFATRYSEAIFFASLLLLDRRRRALLAGMIIGVVLFAGAYDWLTWGSPFASLRAFAEYTLVERASSSRVKAQPPWWYVTSLPFWLAPTLWSLLFVAWRTTSRRIVALLVVPVLALSVIHHKELRYLQVVIPFALLFAAHGAMLWLRRPDRRTLALILLILTIPLHLGRLGGVARRSQNAVRAAHWLSSQNVRSVALSQAWAYGARIHLGNRVAIHDVGTPPSLDARALASDCIALYRSEAPASGVPGFTPRATFDEGASRAVVVSCR